VVDAAKALKKSGIVSDSVGTYEVMYESGRNYVGKGSFSRAIQSATEHAKPNKINDYVEDAVTSIRWKATPDTKTAFIEEYAKMSIQGVGVTTKTYNKIHSPGKRLYAATRELK
jgi:hypothetical protein